MNVGMRVRIPKLRIMVGNTKGQLKRDINTTKKFIGTLEKGFQEWLGIMACHELFLHAVSHFGDEMTMTFYLELFLKAKNATSSVTAMLMALHPSEFATQNLNPCLKSIQNTGFLSNNSLSTLPLPKPLKHKLDELQTEQSTFLKPCQQKSHQVITRMFCSSVFLPCLHLAVLCFT